MSLKDSLQQKLCEIWTLLSGPTLVFTRWCVGCSNDHWSLWLYTLEWPLSQQPAQITLLWKYIRVIRVATSSRSLVVLLLESGEDQLFRHSNLKEILITLVSLRFYICSAWTFIFLFSQLTFAQLHMQSNFLYISPSAHSLTKLQLQSFVVYRGTED